jgi:glucosyl-dolichyl phosphate glucuronosyltransferase
MDVTVILCTYNRCASLERTLQSVARSELPDSVCWEVLVVDNNSSDQTPAVVEKLSRQLPGRFRYCHEPTQGKSYALNTGVREARGAIVAFLDDDVIVEREWLRNLTAPLEKGKWAGVGGRILMDEVVSLPSWLSATGRYCMMGIVCAYFDLGDQARVINYAPYGANMAFRREVFESYGGFRLDLGPSTSADVPRPNEDTEFGRRLMSAGEVLGYEPSAVVYHPVPKERISKKYLLGWWFDYGRAQTRERGQRRDVWGIPHHYLAIPKIVGTTFLARMFHWLTALDPKRRFFWKSQVWVTVGWIAEMLAMANKQFGPEMAEPIVSKRIAAD